MTITIIQASNSKSNMLCSLVEEETYKFFISEKFNDQSKDVQNLICFITENN